MDHEKLKVSSASDSLVNDIQQGSLLNTRERQIEHVDNDDNASVSYLNATMIEDMPVLHYAVRVLQSLHFLQLLLQYGADPNIMHNGERPLHVACMEGLLEVANALIRGGADINQPNQRGRTPLYLAIVYNHVLIVQTLMTHEKRALVSVKDELETPLHVACKLNKLDLVQRLVLDTDDHNRTRSDESRQLTNPIDSRNASGKTPLHYACLQGHEAIFSYLIDQGANPTLKDGKGMGCLHHACFSGSIVIAKRLLEKGVDANAQTNDFRWSPLMIACQQGHNKLVEELFVNNQSHRVQLELRDKLHHTALHFAVEKAYTSIVQILLRQGAKPTVANYEGNTPLILACQCKREGTLDTILALVLNNPMSCLGGRNARKSISPIHIVVPRECPEGTVMIVKYAGTNVFVHHEQKRLWYATKTGFVFEATLPYRGRLLFCKDCCKSNTDRACPLHRMKKRPRDCDEMEA